jgi:uncharacterized protein Yka (UPF0111/DUF47 family)
MKILINEIQYLRLINEQGGKSYTPEEKEIIRKEIMDYVSQFDTFDEFKESPLYRRYYTFMDRHFHGNPEWSSLLDKLNEGIKLKKLNTYLNKISNFESWGDLVNSPEYSSLRKFFTRNFKNHPDYNWKTITEPLREKEKTKKLMDYIDYIQQFKTLRDFQSSPEYQNIYSFLKKYYKNDSLYSYGSLTSNLKRGVKDDRPDMLYLSASEDPDGSIQRIKDYISQFDTYDEFKNSDEGPRIIKWLKTTYNRYNDDRYNLWRLAPHFEKKKSGPGRPDPKAMFDARIDKRAGAKRIKDYISQFQTFEELKNDPSYEKMSQFIQKYFHDDDTFNWKTLTSHLPKRVDQEKKLKEYIDYLSKFESYSDYLKSDEYDKYSKYILYGKFQNRPELKSVIERLKDADKERKVKEIIDYISQFETSFDFLNSPNYRAYKQWLAKYFKHPHKYSWQNLTKDLKK